MKPRRVRGQLFAPDGAELANIWAWIEGEGDGPWTVKPVHDHAALGYPGCTFHADGKVLVVSGATPGGWTCKGGD